MYIRTLYLERGRNILLNEAKKLNTNNNNIYKYLIILDTDDVNINGTFVDSIETCFYYDNWDVLFCNQKTVIMIYGLCVKKKIVNTIYGNPVYNIKKYI
jgi:hypothetical protein